MPDLRSTGTKMYMYAQIQIIEKKQRNTSLSIALQEKTTYELQWLDLLFLVGNTKIPGRMNTGHYGQMQTDPARGFY